MTELIPLILLTSVATFVGTITGFGSSTLMIPLLLTFFPYASVMVFTGIIHWFGNVWKMILFKKGIDKRLLLVIAVPGSIGSYYSAKLVTSFPSEVMTSALALFLIVYIIIVTLKPSATIVRSIKRQAIGGFIAGLVSGTFGIGGVLRASFLHTLHLNKETFLFTAGVIGLLIDSGRLYSYYQQNIQLGAVLINSLVYVIPISFLSALAAKYIVNKIPQKKYRLFIGGTIIAFSLWFLLAA